MIDFKSTLKIALNSLYVNKMRSALTSLGIIIGVAAVIIMLAIGSGANKSVQENMESMGSNLLTVRSATAKTGGVSMGMGTKPTLSIKDADAIKKQARGVDVVAPLLSSTKQVMYGNQNWSTTVYGITSPYLYVKNYEIAKEIKTLKHFLSTIEQSKKYNPDLYENKMLRKAIENKELEYESVKEMINQKEKSLNDYLKTKAVLHEKLRKMRAAKEGKID